MQIQTSSVILENKHKKESVILDLSLTSDMMALKDFWISKDKGGLIIKIVDTYDNTDQITKDLREIERFKDLKKSLENLKNKPGSLDLYQRMDKLQQQILTARNSGQPLSDDVKKEYRKISEKVHDDDKLKDMTTKKQALFQVINDVQQTMAKPIGDLYDDSKVK